MPPTIDEAVCGYPSGQSASDLRQLLETLALREPAEEEISRVKAALSDPWLDLGNAEIEDLVQSWTKSLRRSLTLDVPCVRVLCGFSSVLDTVYQLDPEGEETGKFIAWAALQLGIEKVDELIDLTLKVAEGAQDRRKPRGGAESETWTIDDLIQGDGKAFDLIDVVTLLLWCMQNKGRKPLLNTPDLQKQMGEYLAYRFEQEPPPNLSPSLGGAAGNMCYILRELGLKVAAHWLYHSGPLAEGAPYCLTRVVIPGGIIQEKSAQQKETYFGNDNQMREHPVRRNISFEIPEAMPVRNTGGAVVRQSLSPDRVIYRTLLHRSPDRGWESIVLRVPVLGGGTVDLALDQQRQNEVLGNDGWPFIPLFCSWRIEKDQLVVEVADDAVMRQLAERFDYFILTALQGIGDPITGVPLQRGATGVGRGPKLGDVVRDHLIRQLRVLSDRGVVIHTEIPATSPQLFDGMAEVILRGRVRSIGINDDDLLRITASDDFRGTRFFYAEPDPDERDEKRKHLATFRRCQRADHLARQFDVDELYVHGNDVDIIKRRRASRGALWREIESLLLTKAAVVLALLKRAGAAATDGLSPVLTANGFRGLVEFARSFAQDKYPKDEMKCRALFKELLDCKYFFERDPDAYSVIVAPVLWPDPSPQIVTVGAGDMTSSVVAIFSGK